MFYQVEPRQRTEFQLRKGAVPVSYTLHVRCQIALAWIRADGLDPRIESGLVGGLLHFVLLPTPEAERRTLVGKQESTGETEECRQAQSRSEATFGSCWVKLFHEVDGGWESSGGAGHGNVIGATEGADDAREVRIRVNDGVWRVELLDGYFDDRRAIYQAMCRECGRNEKQQSVHSYITLLRKNGPSSRSSWSSLSNGLQLFVARRRSFVMF